MTDYARFMRRAVELSLAGAKAGGGPFGAVVVKDGNIVGEGSNRVVATSDPTAHAEVVAIRAACEAIGSHRLDGATIYTSCEPCPMCLSAIWWARISRIVYANTRSEAAAIGFDDDAIYREVTKPLGERSLPIERLESREARDVFSGWFNDPNRILY